MQRLTIEVTPRITSVYQVDVPDDFDIGNQDALNDLASKLMGDNFPESMYDNGVEVTVVSDEPHTLVP